MVKNLEQRNGVWYFSKRIDGRRFRLSTGFRDRKAAERRAAELEVKVRNGLLGWTTHVPTLAEWAKTYQRSYTPRKRDPRRDRQIIAHALRLLGAGKRLDDVLQSDCERYMNLRMGEGASPGTINRERGLLGSMWNAAIRDGLVSQNPWKGIKHLKTEARTRVLRAKEQEKLLAALNVEYRRLVTTVLGSGLRERELLGLRLQDVRDGTLIVRAETAKGQKRRVVPLRPEVQRAIQEQAQALRRESDERLWSQTPWAVLKTIGAACKRAKIEPVTMHDLRRTFSTRCALSGMPMVMLKDLLGHSSMEVTAKYYVHARQQDLAEALEQADLRLPEADGARVLSFKSTKKSGHITGHSRKSSSEVTANKSDSRTLSAQGRRATRLRYAPMERAES